MTRRPLAYRVLALGLAVSIASTGITGTAFAQTPPPDNIVLKDGSTLKGRITEMKEGSHVLVQLEGGQVARVRWDGIARIERSGPPPAAPAPAAAPATPAPYTPGATAVAPAGDTVILHIDSPEPARLESVRGRETSVVCEAPCDIPVPLAGVYRISGPRTSKNFTLRGSPGERVTLTVDPSSRGAFVGGVVLVSVGGASLVIGLFVWMIGALAEAVDHRNNNADTTGLVMMGLGAGAIAGGIVMMVSNGASKVMQGDAPATRAKGELYPRIADGELKAADPWKPTTPAFVAPLTFKF